MAKAQLDRRAVALAAGITVDTLDTYVRDGRAPKPDGYLGRTPFWYTSTVARWVRTRRTKPGNLSKTKAAK